MSILCINNYVLLIGVLKMNKITHVAVSMKNKNNIIRKSGALVVAFSCFLPAAVYATNGLFMIGNGNKSKGMGGVGIAAPMDS